MFILRLELFLAGNVANITNYDKLAFKTIEYSWLDADLYQSVITSLYPCRGLWVWILTVVILLLLNLAIAVEIWCKLIWLLYFWFILLSWVLVTLLNFIKSATSPSISQQIIYAVSFRSTYVNCLVGFHPRLVPLLLDIFSRLKGVRNDISIIKVRIWVLVLIITKILIQLLICKEHIYLC